MKQSLQKLQKFFKLEAERGYDNHAVVGGLDRMLDMWVSEARNEAVSEDLIQTIISRVHDYPRLTPASRAEVLEGLWKRIQRQEGLTVTPAALVPEKKSSPSPKPPPSSNTGERRGKPSNPPPSRDAQPEPPRKNFNPAVARIPVSAPGLPDDPGKEDNYGIKNNHPTENVQAEPPAPRRQFQEDPHPVEPSALDAPVTVLHGVGASYAEILARLNIKTLRDMLYYLPRRYDDYSRLKPINHLWYGEEVTIIATVQNVSVRPLQGGHGHIIEAIVSDGTGALRLNWFNQVYVAKRLRPDTQIVISGKVEQYLGRLVMKSPEFEPLEQQQLSTNRIVPVYPLTANITQRWLRKTINTVVEYWAPRLADMLPANIRQSAGLVSLGRAILQIHFPDSWEELSAARDRLAFDEILLLQLGVLGQKRAWQARTARKFAIEETWFQQQVSSLPFPLTGAQLRSLQDIQHDLASGQPMNRLLQGDVGSGKTIIAALAIGMITNAGAQAALMAPTSILAEQHYRNLLKILAGYPSETTPEITLPPEANDGQASETIQTETVPASEEITDDLTPVAAEQSPADTDQAPEQIALIPPFEEVSPNRNPPLLAPGEIRLMIGATPEPEKREIRQGLANGEIKLVIGTHALIEDPVQFADLELTVIDEQHRFGVDQRAALRSKGANPHLLVMTATPIPRSLALTVYGDLDLSVMDEMPPGRQAVNTHLVSPRERERAYNLIRMQAQKGRQAFIIYPLVEESEKSEAKAAVEEHNRLQKDVFPDLKLGLLHGRLRPEEKEEAMTRFRDREFQVLVSTSVVEVGVDIPNATVMLIEGANRFGLAQLHQFRGRVGRGAEQSYCILIPDNNEETENQRLQVMTETNDGFVLAERDLEQRGPGQFLGTRQSGFSELQLASLTNIHLIENARRHALQIFEKDPELSGTEYAALKTALSRFWGQSGKGDIS